MFASIYTHHHPNKAGELIQYNHVIHTISLTYAWDNVYAYDKEFRLHVSRHPERSWSVILQQAWSMKLRDRIVKNDNYQSTFHTPTSSGSGHKSKFGEHCKCFDYGKCNLGSGCRYEHKCDYCNKFGHGVMVCHKLVYDREKHEKANKNPQNKQSGVGAAVWDNPCN